MLETLAAHVCVRACVRACIRLLIFVHVRHRHGDGYDDMLDWIRTNSAMGRKLKQSDVHSTLVIDPNVEQEPWVSAVR